MNFNCPEALFMVPSALLVFDHRLRSLKIIVNAFLGDRFAGRGLCARCRMPGFD
jgi:hypothetical protein